MGTRCKSFLDVRPSLAQAEPEAAALPCEDSRKEGLAAAELVAGLEEGPGK